MTAITLPKRGRGRQSEAAQAQHEADLEAFCAAILEINSRLDFRVSSRGWCYLLEEHGLDKGDFDTGQRLINDCRKSGLLPLDICSEDAARQFGGVEQIDLDDPDDEAEFIVDYCRDAYLNYTPFSFWRDKDVYIQAFVEKIDLKNLFAPVFNQFCIPFANTKGWSDLNSRAALMRRFKDMEADGKQCVLLYCGDHDPGGLSISGFLRSNMEELADAVGWSPRNLIIDRFGLNFEFIEAQRLTWIDNLATSGKKRLDDPRHPDHHKPYVQDYLSQFGTRKVEANALVARPEAGRELCRQAVLNYLNEGDPDKYTTALEPHRLLVRDAVSELMVEGIWS